MSAPSQIIANILRVDHAGEYGAVCIYRAQLWFAKLGAPDLAPALERILEDEVSHREAFEREMLARNITPCRTLAFWGLGGSLLGLVTGALGRNAIFVCTGAVERRVHKHLNDRVEWLQPRDDQLAKMIDAIQFEELEHLRFAEEHSARARRRIWARVLDALVAAATESLIWLSTYGASGRLKTQFAL